MVLDDDFFPFPVTEIDFKVENREAKKLIRVQCISKVCQIRSDEHLDQNSAKLRSRFRIKIGKIKKPRDQIQQN